MFDRVLLRSGQFILTKTKVEIDIDSFRLLVEDALAQYNKYNPYEKYYQLLIHSPREFTFTPEYDQEIKRVPDWISKCTPIRTSGYSAYSVANSAQSFNSELNDPVQAPWVYRKPVLSLPFSSKYEVLAIYNHIVVGTPDPDNGDKTIYDVPTITTEDQSFLKLLQGMFLQGLGRSRRSFTINDLPITADADTIASEGKEIEDSALESMQTNSKFYLAYR